MRNPHARTKEPRSPGAQEPRSPGAQEPGARSPGAQEPTSLGAGAQEPRAQEPRNPGAQEPRSPGAQERSSPGAQERSSPGAQEPRIPGAQEPRSPGTQEPRSPGAQEPRPRRSPGQVQERRETPESPGKDINVENLHGATARAIRRPAGHERVDNFTISTSKIWSAAQRERFGGPRDTRGFSR